MNELTLDGKTYVSSKRAAEITGYAKDYVGQLCREGHVEARLVGRNWYVLETSIREHRFGTKDEEMSPEAPKKSVSTWEPPVYKSEVPTYIPPISTEVKDAERSAVIAERVAMLSDMQSAWQEWGTKRKTTPESQNEEDSSQDETSVQEEAPVEEESTVVLHELEEDVPESETIEEVVEVEKQAYEPLNLKKEVETEYDAEEPQQEYVTPRRTSRMRNLVLQSIFVLVAVVSVAITAVGTGIATKYTALGQYRLSEINFIAGVSTYNK